MYPEWMGSKKSHEVITSHEGEGEAPPEDPRHATRQQGQRLLEVLLADAEVLLQLGMGDGVPREGKRDKSAEVEAHHRPGMTKMVPCVA
jgi:hypothetical protein